MRFRWLSVSLAVAVLVAVVAGSVAERHRPRPYNLIVLTVELWRIDALTPKIMPNVLAAAASGRLFRQHRAIAAWTIPNIVTLLTGISPFAQGINARGDALPAGTPTPLGRLAADGWTVRGLQPFMVVEGFSNLGVTYRTDESLMPWLARRALARKPFVLWYHYLGTHLPYAPAPEFRPDVDALLPPGDAAARRRIAVVMRQPIIPAGSVHFQPGDAAAITALHDGSYRQFDAWFGRLWRFLGDSGLLDDTIVVLTADHADEHLEHGNVGHASTNHAGHLHDEVVRVPLVLWLPPRHPEAALARGVEDRPTDHLQVMPSLEALVRGLPSPPGALLDPPADRPWMAVTSRGGFSDPAAGGDQTFVGARLDHGRKVMVTMLDKRVTAAAAYDMAADPWEQHPLPVGDGDADLRTLVTAMRTMAASHPATVTAAAGPAMAGPPRWVWPDHSGDYRYDDLAGRFRLQWTGRADRAYTIEYQAGEGAMALSGRMETVGPAKDFGDVGRRYWDTFVVPLGRVRLRVGSGGEWSPWLEARVKP